MLFRSNPCAVFVGRCFIDVRDEYRGTITGEAPGRSTANSLSATGNNCDLAVKPRAHCLISFRECQWACSEIRVPIVSPRAVRYDLTVLRAARES